MFMLSIIFVIVGGLFAWKRICAGFQSFVDIFIAVGDSAINREIGIPLTGLMPPHCCTCPRPGTAFPKSYVLVCFNLCSVS